MVSSAYTVAGTGCLSWHAVSALPGTLRDAHYLPARACSSTSLPGLARPCRTGLLPMSNCLRRPCSNRRRKQTEDNVQLPCPSPNIYSDLDHRRRRRHAYCSALAQQR